MKKRLVCMMMTGAVAASLLGGCGSSTAATPQTAVTNDEASTQASQTDVEDEKASKDTDSPAQQTSASDFKTKVKDDGTIEIELYRGEASEVVIPDTIDGKEVSVVGGFGNHDEITSVVIPDTVKEISYGAFQNCFGLASVKMSANVEKIGSFAFAGKFEEIQLPSTLVEIGSNAFNSVHLKKVTIPNSVEILEHGSFMSTDIESIIIPGSVKCIEQQVFEECKQLKEVTIEDGVETIEKSFKYCTALEKVTIPASVTEIDPNAFKGCENVTIIAEPGSYAESYANEQGIQVRTHN